MAIGGVGEPVPAVALSPDETRPGRPVAALPAPLWARSCAGLLLAPMKFLVGILKVPSRGPVQPSASVELAAQEQDERYQDRERNDEAFHLASPRAPAATPKRG